MNDRSSESMFDYDTRPITRQVLLISRSAAYSLRDFLSPNGITVVSSAVSRAFHEQ